MKIRAFKKAISVVCVLSMLLSLCVVSFIGTASAAGIDYTLNNNGVEYTLNLAKGATIPAPTAPVDGVVFLGWYDDINFTNEVKVAGDDTTLFAKYEGVAATFDYTNSAVLGVYNPNETFGVEKSLGAFQIVDDPKNPNNKVLLGDQLYGGTNTISVAIEAYPGSNKGFTYEVGKKYVVRFKYMATPGAQPSDKGIQLGIYMSAQEGVGKSGNKSDISKTYFQYTSNWVEASVSFTVKEANASRPYIIFTVGDGNFDRGKFYMDDIVIREEMDEQNYTLNNKGEEEVITAKAGQKLPVIATASFLGWYDETLTNKYDLYPFITTKLYAKYDGTTADIDSGVFKPNSAKGSYMSVVADPLNANNKALAILASDGSNAKHFAPLGAAGAKDGLKLVNGKVYTISFNFLAKNIENSKVSVSVRAAAKNSIGTTGNKTEAMSTFEISANTSEWIKGSFNFTFNGTEEMPYLIFVAQQDGASQTANVYFDDIVIKPYIPKVVVEDVVMDFDDKDGNEFAWSEDVNDYTYNSGNGFVTRGEIIKEADGLNRYFRLTHSNAKNGNYYFTVNNGIEQFTAINGGIYTIEFDYFVEHSETPSKLNLYYVNTDGKGAVRKIATFDEFNYRDDDVAQGWAHVEYTFIADQNAIDYSSLGLGLFNSTNCPEEFATAVLFDNIRIKTHSTTGEDTIILFDSTGGDACEKMTVEVGTTVADLPAPNRYGYIFSGWKYDITVGEGDDAVTTSYDLNKSTKIPAGLINAYAVWSLKPGAVELSFRTNVEEYDANVGTVVAFTGQPITGMPAAPEFDNQTFLGWYLDRNFNKALNLKSAPAESVTLFAKWQSGGILVDYEDYTITDGSQKSDRFTLVTEENGNKALLHSLETGTNKDPGATARAMFQKNGKLIGAYEGAVYTIKFKYRVENFNSSGKIHIYTSNPGNTWSDYRQQDGYFLFTGNTNGWEEASITFTATLAEGASPDHNILSLCCTGDAHVYFDDVVITCPENEMNIYGSAIRFNTTGGEGLSAISGEVGDKIVLPTPKKAGYKFVGWYEDIALTIPFKQTVFGEEPILIYADWQLGKLEEDFENFPATVAQMGISSAYSLYSMISEGYDASNIRSGNFSLFRNGATSGVNAFTAMRTDQLALEVGETYTVKMWVKPTATATTGAITVMNMNSFTGITSATVNGIVAAYADLTEGEWQQVSYTFVAETPYIAIGTAAGCDIYFDDITVTLKGYTGSASNSAPTGDTSVNPIIILAAVVLSAGVLLITCKKVFAK